MEFIRRNSDYALRALGRLSAFPMGKRLTVKEMASREDVPALFLRKIFQRLSSAGIVASRKGPDGGFYLVRDAGSIALRDVLEAVQGRVSISDCILNRDSCIRAKRCPIRKTLSGVERRFFKLLDKYTLKDFCPDNGSIG